MRTSNVTFESDALRIRAVCCRVPAHGCGGIEYSSTSTLVLPQSGVFVKYEGPHDALIADAAHGVFFTANQPYRVSHPADTGDDCLVLEYRPAALLEVLETVDPAAADAPGTPFPPGVVRLDPMIAARRRMLWHRLTRRIADPLEVEETALALFSAAFTAGRNRPARRRSRRTRSNRAEIVRATHATIASRPSEPWSLDALARRVHCSPFHLAHVFREDVGVSIHQYHLRARLTRALDDILDSTRSLSAIGLDAGFAHHSHFTAAFRRTFGGTPSLLRRCATTAHAAEFRKFLTAPPGAPR
jgi:AraC-like DNA-binding protein